MEDPIVKHTFDQLHKLTERYNAARAEIAGSKIKSYEAKIRLYSLSVALLEFYHLLEKIAPDNCKVGISRDAEVQETQTEELCQSLIRLDELKAIELELTREKLGLLEKILKTYKDAEQAEQTDQAKASGKTTV